MDESMGQVMSRVIAAMYERVGEELTVDDMARTARYSKFHFSRVFRQATGVSPARFLSILRFQEAKRLLSTTSLSVAEISNLVGYSSLGTFSTRFKRSVGVTPTEYRRGGFRQPCLASSEVCSPDGPTATVRGRVCAAELDGGGPTFVGLFPDPAPQGPPVGFLLLDRPGDFLLSGVPAGRWYLVADGVLSAPGLDVDSAESLVGAVGRLGPITVSPGAELRLEPVRLRQMGPMDLPVLPAPFATRPGELARWRRALRPVAHTYNRVLAPIT